MKFGPFAEVRARTPSPPPVHYVAPLEDRVISRSLRAYDGRGKSLAPAEQPSRSIPKRKAEAKGPGMSAWAGSLQLSGSKYAGSVGAPKSARWASWVNERTRG